MSFPSTWLQTFLKLPPSFATVGGPSPQGYWNQWWTFTGPLPSTYSFVIMNHDFQTWCATHLSFVIATSQVPFGLIEGQYYIEDGTGVVGPVIFGFPGPLWLSPRPAPYPGVMNLMYRFYCSTYPGRAFRKYLGPVNAAVCDSDKYFEVPGSPLAGFGNALCAGFTSQGVSFTAGAASYRDKAFYPYETFRIYDDEFSQYTHLWICKRRGRQKNPAGPLLVPMPVP